MPKVTVIIPVYNAEKYLKKALDSVINQTLEDIEVVCIDDGSNDNSLEILKSYQEFDNRIIIISQNNQGSGAARNTGLNFAKGEYISFLDSDDFLPDEFVLMDLYSAVSNKDVQIAGGSLVEFLSDSRRRFYLKGDPRQFDKDGYVKYIDYQYDYYYQRFLYSRKFLLDNELMFPLSRRHQDVLFFVKTMVIASEFFSLKRCTYCYRADNKKIIWKREIVFEIISVTKELIKIAHINHLDRLSKRLYKRLAKQYLTYIGSFIGVSKIIENLYVYLKKYEQNKFFK